MKQNKLIIRSFIFLFLIGLLFLGCNKDKVKEIIREIPTITDIPEITKDTKENISGLKSLSENYVIKNVKKGNKLIADTRKAVENAEKKDKKKALKIFVKDYKEIVDFYRKITKEKKVEEVKEELMSYYTETVKFYEDLEIMEKSLGSEKDDFTSKLKAFGDNLSREDNVRKTTLEERLKNSERQEKMIKDFKIYYGQIIPEVEKVQADVDYFVLVLQETADVYESAYRTAELSLNISTAIDNILELSTLDDLSNEIMASWENLDVILDNLTNIADFVM